MNKVNQQITTTEYNNFQEAYDFFNVQLFDKALPACLITLQRKGRTLGYFCPGRFQHRTTGDVLTDEIALNPDGFAGRDDKDILSTLVHEQVHLWQAHFGARRSRSGYHNREWAGKMVSIGLIPSDTGEPVGKQTGQHMTHYIQPDGIFDACADELLGKGFRLNWESALIVYLGGTRLKRYSLDSSKVKFSCPSCGQNAWAKQTAKLLCGICRIAMD